LGTTLCVARQYRPRQQQTKIFNLKNSKKEKQKPPGAIRENSNYARYAFKGFQSPTRAAA
jgi:hypothetical protein